MSAGDDGDGEYVSDGAGDDNDDVSDGDDDGSNGDDDDDGAGTGTNDCTGDNMGLVCSLVLVLEKSQSPKCQCTDTLILCKWCANKKIRNMSTF